jgi:serine/threonine-protein phosphatase 6 regulatory subunit 3
MVGNKFSSWDSPGVLANATEILCVVTRCAPPSIAKNIHRPSYIGRFSCHALAGTGHKSLMVHFIVSVHIFTVPKMIGINFISTIQK